MKTPAQLDITVRTDDGRAYSERMAATEEREYYDELVGNGANPHIAAITFEHWVRPVRLSPAELAAVNGNHFVYGWFESFAQSGRCPDFFYTTPIESIEVAWS